MNNVDLVRNVYRAVLKREPEQNGLAGYVKFLDGGGDVREFISSILSSSEFRNIISADDSAYSIEHQGRMLKVLRMLAPYDVASKHKIRIGREYDGGYVMIDDFSSISAAYSLGINDDVSWDLDIAKYGINIFQYDHSIDSTPVQNDRFHFNKKMIVGNSDGNLDVITLEDAIQSNGHVNSSNLLLKIDIEGSEWDVFNKISLHTLRQFSQIVCEVHDLGHLRFEDNYKLIYNSFEKLTSAHKVVHVHANNYAPWIICGGVAVPDVMEISFQRIDNNVFIYPSETFPTTFDMPNNRNRPDYALGYFRF